MHLSFQFPLVRIRSEAESERWRRLFLLQPCLWSRLSNCTANNNVYMWSADSGALGDEQRINYS